MQAKKKKSTKSRNSRAASSRTAVFSLSAFWIFASGLLIGVLATLLLQGIMKPRTDIGVGIRNMIQESRESAVRNQASNNASTADEEPLETNYDFFTVLPEVEVVVADSEVQQQDSSKPQQKEQKKEETPQQDTGSAYMLQAGSYKSEADARNLKVNLALNGLRAEVQKVTIQGRGDFYRVRLGPYSSYSQMEEVNGKLAAQGINAMRLKVSN